MAHALEKALAEVATLPEDEQSRLGEWLLAELAAEPLPGELEFRLTNVQIDAHPAGWTVPFADARLG